MLEYNTYCVWLYNEKNEIIDNDNPLEWKEDKDLIDAFIAVSDLYDTFFIDHKTEFHYIGCPNEETRQKLISLINFAVDILYKKVNGKYPIQNDIEFNF